MRADFDLPISSSYAKLLYFLNFHLQTINIEFGAGIFVDINKEHVRFFISIIMLNGKISMTLFPI